MKSLLKIIFNVIIFVGIGLWDPMGNISGTPGIVGLVCLYTSYVILKQIHKIQFVKNLFN